MLQMPPRIGHQPAHDKTHTNMGMLARHETLGLDTIPDERIDVMIGGDT